MLTDTFSPAADREPLTGMRLHRIVSQQLSREGDGLSVRAAIDAVVAINVNEPEGAKESAREQEVGKRPKEVPDE